MKKINVLILGSGGREHALAWKLSQSRLLENLYIAPGNAGTSQHGENLAIDVNDFQAIRGIVLERNIGMLVVGPEEPLVRGIRDFFQSDNDLMDVMVIGPGKAGAQLEGSKDYAKQFMTRHGIPTAGYRTFSAGEYEEAVAFLHTLNPPYVLKADGLAAGKGVVICKTMEEAEHELSSMLLNKRFGAASARVVIEEFLEGIELSAFAITDGESYLMLPEAKDYKRVGNGDTGLNTGGMGSVSPVPFAGSEFMQKVEELVIRPTVEGLKKDSVPYVGFIFAGLMKVKENPYVIEYNVRLGDPETEVILPRIQSDLLEVFIALATGKLAEHKIFTDPRAAGCVMMVSGGYPGDYSKGYPVELPVEPVDSTLFHAGTKIVKETGEVVTSGGRVLAVSSLGNDFQSALEKSYATIREISFTDQYYRTDIGFDLTNS